MKAYLIRVGIDSSIKSGRWNAPVNSVTREFAYVPITENRRVFPELKRAYHEFIDPCRNVGKELPHRLLSMNAHLDPDFSKLTYGDVCGKDLSTGRFNYRGQPLKELKENDILVFYAGLYPVGSNTGDNPTLTYAIIGLYKLQDTPIPAIEFARGGLSENNAHTRCQHNEFDIVCLAKPIVSGRLDRCIPIGRFRDGAYRVDRDLLLAWGGLDVSDGWIQRSAILPCFKDPDRYYYWLIRQLKEQNISLVERNN